MQPKQDLLAKVLQYKRWLIIGGGVIVLLFIVSLFFQGGPSAQERAINVQDRILKLQEFIAANRSSITTTALANQSANAAVILSGASSSIQKLNETIGAKATNEAKKQNAARLAEFKIRMTTAKEANTFELRYRQTLVDELKAIAVQAAALARSTNESIKTTFTQVYSNLNTAQTDLAKIEL
ncbi:MAG TPA: hypothetical protein VFZ58_04070 [Candidatus Saccharimonadales bacterium]